MFFFCQEDTSYRNSVIYVKLVFVYALLSGELVQPRGRARKIVCLQVICKQIQTCCAELRSVVEITMVQLTNHKKFGDKSSQQLFWGQFETSLKL